MRICDTRSCAHAKPPSVVSHLVVPSGASPRSAQMFRMPPAFACSSARSTFSASMFVQVRCMFVVTPSLCIVSAMSRVASLVVPPAPHVISLARARNNEETMGWCWCHSVAWASKHQRTSI